MKTVAHNRLCLIAIEKMWAGVIQVQAKATINMALLSKSTRSRVLRGFNRGYIGQTTSLAYELYHVLCTASGIPTHAIGRTCALITLEREHAVELEKDIKAIIKLTGQVHTSWRYHNGRRESESNSDWDTVSFARLKGMTHAGFLNLIDKYPRVTGDPAKVDAVRKMVNDGRSFESALLK